MEACKVKGGAVNRPSPTRDDEVLTQKACSAGDLTMIRAALAISSHAAALQHQAKPRAARR
jgi:hypothetical protein